MNIEFIKKNWEKVLLGAVLVGLLIAVVSLPIKISREKQELSNIRNGIISLPVEPIEAPDLTSVRETLRRTEQRFRLDLTTSNRVFNPVEWKRSPNGQLIRVNTGDEIGIRAVQVEAVLPLYLVVSLDSVLTTDSGSRYAIGIERQAARSRRDRGKRQSYAARGEETEHFVLTDVKGPAESPTALELQLRDTGERITVTPEEPFRRVDGYMADLEYSPDSRKWAGKRIDDLIPVEREYYKIVAITEDEVVVSAPSGKKTTLHYHPGT